MLRIFDEPPEKQTKVAEITLDRAKRLVEQGKDVIILLDSITRLARAYNLSVAPSGRTLSGGFDPAALWPAKKFFGAARNCKDGGSLTIIGTALVDTGSRMDDLIYEEFKGTGNLELHLDRRLADRRIFPSIDVERSGTRQEELLFSPEELKKAVTMRRMLDMLSPDERTSILVERLSKTESNEEFLKSLGKRLAITINISLLIFFSFAEKRSRNSATPLFVAFSGFTRLNPVRGRLLILHVRKTGVAFKNRKIVPGV